MAHKGRLLTTVEPAKRAKLAFCTLQTHNSKTIGDTRIFHDPQLINKYDRCEWHQVTVM